ncbi:MAG: CoA-binding protein [Bacteroidales bacterium]|nr:CoA-binding protein [Bacteroidales bacterium]
MMKDTIQSFLDDKKVAIAGASNNKENFGKTLMTELIKLGYKVYPVNPRCEEIEGTTCIPTIKELPEEVHNLILVVPPRLTEEIIEQCVDTPIQRVWMHRGIGKGSASETALEICGSNNIEAVHGFCPLMFYGKGFHRFHLWIRKTFGKVPAEYMI